MRTSSPAALLGVLVAVLGALPACDSGPVEAGAPFDPALLVGTTWVVGPMAPPHVYTGETWLSEGVALEFAADGSGVLHNTLDAPVPLAWSVSDGAVSIDVTVAWEPHRPYVLALERIELSAGRLAFSATTEVRDPATGAVRQASVRTVLAPGQTAEEVFVEAARAEPEGFTRTPGGTAQGVVAWDRDDWRVNPTAQASFGIMAPPGANPFYLRPPATDPHVYLYTTIFRSTGSWARPRIDAVRLVGRSQSGADVELARTDGIAGMWDGENTREDPVFAFDPSVLAEGSPGLFRVLVLDQSDRVLSYGDVQIE